MADSFAVELEALAGLIKSLSTSSEHMRGATNALKAASASDLGHEKLDSAAKDFQDRWDHGIQKIAQAAQKVTENLHEAKASYEAIEHEVTSKLQEITSAIDGGAPAGGAPAAGGAAPTGGASPSPQPDSKITRVLNGGAQ